MKPGLLILTSNYEKLFYFTSLAWCFLKSELTDLHEVQIPLSWYGTDQKLSKVSWWIPHPLSTLENNKLCKNKSNPLKIQEFKIKPRITFPCQSWWVDKARTPICDT